MADTQMSLIRKTVAAVWFSFLALTAIAQEAPAKKHRIISSAPVVTEILFAIGAGEDVVGVDDYSKYPPEAAQKKSIGSLRNLNIETLIALQPTHAVIYGQNPDLEAFCKQRGVEKVNVMIETTADLLRVIETLGAETGQTDKAKTLTAQLRRQLDAVRKQAEGKTAPKVLVVIGREVGSFQNVLSIGRGSFLDELITLAGGQNVFHEMEKAYPIVSSEQIIASGADIVLELPGEGAEVKNAEQRRKDWSVFKSLPATKSGRIQFMTGDYLLIPGPRIGKTAEDLFNAIHK